MPDFSPSEQIFPIFFLLCISWQRRTCCQKIAEQNSAGKQKKQARIFQARKHEVHIFSADSIFAPGLTGQQSPVLLLYRAPYLPAASFITPGVSRPISSRYSSLQSKSQPSGHQRLSPGGSRPASPAGRRLLRQFLHQPPRPTHESPNAFLQLRFFKCKNARCTFFSIQQTGLFLSA